MTYLPWPAAWQRALYGPDGFYRRRSPAAHFRTSVHASGLLATALDRLARDAGLRQVVDVGSGRGELLAALHAQQADQPPPDRLGLVGLDVGLRPGDLPAEVRWVPSSGGAELPEALDQHTADALVLAHEWLDVVPAAVLQRDDRLRWREVLVDPRTGVERLGALAEPGAQEWLARWWPPDPAPEAGHRAEVGATRDAAWAALVRRCPGALLVAVDYGHQRADRPPFGTLIGYRDGAACTPVPDGSCDVTAHVALDAVAAAGRAAGAAATVLTTQRGVLRSLGVDGTLPAAARAGSDPHGYLRALGLASQAGELLDPGGLGGFGWLLQLGAQPASGAADGQRRQALARLEECR